MFQESLKKSRKSKKWPVEGLVLAVASSGVVKFSAKVDVGCAGQSDVAVQPRRSPDGGFQELPERVSRLFRGAVEGGEGELGGGGTVEFLPVGHSSRSLGASELLQKAPSTRSHTLETLETTQNLI